MWLSHANAREGLIKARRTRGHHGVGLAGVAIDQQSGRVSRAALNRIRTHGIHMRG